MSLMANKDTILVLSNKHLLPDRMSLSMQFSIFIVITILLIVYITAVIFPEARWDLLFAKLLERLGKFDWAHIDWTQIDWTNNLLNLAMFGLMFGQILYFSRAQKIERLTLSLDGIRYTSPLPSIFKQFKPDWFLPWSQINRAELGTLNGRLISSEFILLTLFTSSEQRRIIATLWIDAKKYTRPKFQFKFTPMTQSHDEILKLVMSSEVLCYIGKNVPHLSIDSKLNSAEVITSLEKNPHGKIAIGIVSLLMAYAFFDTILGSESYIDEPMSLLHIYFSAGIVGVILSGIWLYKSTLATSEKVGLAMLIGFLVAVAMLPGALRVNAMTDSNPKIYDYQVTTNNDGVVLSPVVEGMPAIYYFAKNKFWTQFNKNDTYPVQIHKGSLGFYQFNSSITIDDIHSHQDH